MIIDSDGMKKIEKASGIPVSDLMETAGKFCADQLLKDTAEGSRILILAGKGNNGGDGFVAARLLKDVRTIHIFLTDGEPKTDAARDAYKKLPRSMFIGKRKFPQILALCDAVVDAVYGFGFKGTLSAETKKIFKDVNASRKPVFSIDINSGCEADSGHCDKDALHSEVTYALDCFKPFHMLRKEHGRFRTVRLLPLGLPHDIPSLYREMNEELFFRNFPVKAENSYKATFGKTLLACGSKGMAGAACFNILGARTAGASYLYAAVPEEIYTITASHFMSPVFKPFTRENWREVFVPLIKDVRSIGFGSGAVNMPDKRDIMDMILQESSVPVVLDAEALRLLVHNTYLLRFVKEPVILTPHIGEFAAMANLPAEAVRDQPVTSALQFAKDYKCIVVLKGPNTIVASAAGDVYINQTGNQALAQAGSGDILTGIMTAVLSMTSDVFTGVCMSVWLHGYLAELGTQSHSIQAFPLESYPELMDQLFRKHGL